MDLHNTSLIAASSVLMYTAFKRLLGKSLLRNNKQVIEKREMSTILEGHKYPAKEHCLRAKDHFLSKKKGHNDKSMGFFIAGEELEPIKYCDQAKTFRQNRYFFYLTGCNIPGSSMLFNLKNERLTLFLPNVDEEDIMWSGLPMSIEEAKKTYDVDEILFAKEIESSLKEIEGFDVFTTDLDNVHCEALKSKLIPDDKDFFYALDESRLIKDWYELELMRKACQITDVSHLAVMSALPIEKTEGHIHAEFTYHALRQGSKFQGYDPICCSGPSCSTLHYVKNDDDMAGKDSVLIDAGAEWENYTADVTRCFPINGKWTKEHREIYDLVLDMQTTAMSAIKPGESWEKIHLLAHKVLIKHFLKLGIFKSTFTEEQIFDSKASVCFFPHGLGHLLGLDTHDVGGCPNYEDPNPYLRYLRLRRNLRSGMVVTNEPGCYFNPFLIKELLDKHPERLEVVNKDVMEKYLYIGGVRIEDNILITSDGYENLTTITSDPDEIEKIVSEGIAKGRSHFHAIV